MPEQALHDYNKADDKAGNVRRVARKSADVPGPDPVNWSVEATDFEYHRNGEVRMIIQRTWHESSGTVSNDELVSIHEVRGNGRRRHMLRPWNFQSDGQGGWTLSPDNASALWTVYDGDEPTADYRIIDGDGPGFTGDLEKSYTLGLAQRTGEGEVKYFHTDHLGTTQAMTDASQTPEPRIVYTAFGEVISTSSPPDTRYQYAGDKGYESFTVVPFLHVGARWYDPASGRFLQRDPMGTRAWPNVYEYAASKPTRAADPTGRWTVQLGIGGSVILGPFTNSYVGSAAQGDLSVAMGFTWEGVSVGWLVTGGAGGGFGAYIGGGIVGGISTAPHVSDLKGRSVELGPN